jgi:hypothetical protein
VTEEQANNLLGLGNKLVTSLPAQFLALALINLVIVGCSGTLARSWRRASGCWWR